MIELRDVHKAFGETVILNGMTFQVPQGQNYVLMGRSGIGKSVTLKHIVGVLKADRGEVLVDDQDVGSMQPKELRDLRRRMGYLFQNGALINWLSVAENVALPLREHSNMDKAEILERTMKVLEMVGMEHAAANYPPRISGGMKLRTGLARAIITEPEYVLYDEPNAGLDPIISDQIHELICRVRDDLGVTGLVVTHSRACAFSVADRIGVIDDGKIFAEGTVEEMRNSDLELVQHFMGGGAD